MEPFKSVCFIRGRLGRYLALVCLLGVAGCSGGSLTEEQAVKGGVYKVGKPYVIKGRQYRPAENYSYDEVGIASWYGPGFHGKNTANGEIFDENLRTAAHPTLPMPTIAEVTNLENGRVLRVRINDRGPFAHDRLIDLSKAAAEDLGFRLQGLAKVRVRVLERESLAAARAMGVNPIRTASTQPSLAREITATHVPQTPVVSRPLEPVQQQPVFPQASQIGSSLAATQIYVQAGAFSSLENANQLAQTLAGIHPRPAVQPLNVVGQAPVYRVRMGPVANLTEADKLLREMAHQGHYDVRVVVE